jgi:hypothetical protein
VRARPGSPRDSDAVSLDINGLRGGKFPSPTLELPQPSREASPIGRPRFGALDVVGSRLPRPYNFRAGNQSFQWVATQFPSLFRLGLSLSRRDSADRNRRFEEGFDALRPAHASRVFLRDYDRPRNQANAENQYRTNTPHCQ